MARIPRGRIGSLVALMQKRGFDVTLQKYPQQKGAWMLEVVANGARGAKANFRVVIPANSMTIKHLTSIRVGGKRALMNYARAIGNIGEARLVNRIRSGSRNFPNSAPPPPLIDVQFEKIIQVQNRSGHGLDLVAKAVPPPSPPGGQWVAFEAKTRMETPTFPPLSTEQARDAQDYVLTRAQRAIDGAVASQSPGATTTTWAGMAPHLDDLEDLKNAAANGNVITIHAQVPLNKHGNLDGEILMGAW